MEELLRLVRQQQKQLDSLQDQLNQKRESPTTSDEAPKRQRRRRTPPAENSSCPPAENGATLGKSRSYLLLQKERAIRATKSPQEQHVRKSLGKMIKHLFTNDDIKGQ